MTRKTVFKILGGVAIVVVAIIALVFYATSGITKAADEFFAQAREGDIEKTYALTSAQLQNVTSSEQLAGFIEANRFDRVATTSWSSRSIRNNVGSLRGTVTLDDGGVIPISMELVSEGDAWKVSMIELQDAGLKDGTRETASQDPSASAASPEAVPPDHVVRSQVEFKTGVLLDAARRDDMAYFKAFWVDGITEAQLRELTRGMQSAGGAAEQLEDVRPVVESVVPYREGGFTATGHAVAPSWRYDFTYSFVPDGQNWNLEAVEYDLNSI